MGRKITIIHLITGLSTGGAETMLYKLLKGTDRNQFSPIVISLIDKGTIGDSIKELGIPVYSFGLKTKDFNIINLIKLLKVLKRSNPEIIQGWMYHGNMVALLLKIFFLNKPKIIWNIRQSLYSLSYEKNLTKIIIKLNSILSRYVDRIIYNSKLSCSQHESLGFYKAKSLVIPNGFDLKTFRLTNNDVRYENKVNLGIRPKAFLIGIVARYHPMKDHRTFLLAAKQALLQNPNIIFVMVGKGINQENTELISLINELEIKENILMLDEIKNISDIMATLDILVSSSITEAFSNVIGEAMACGVPCVVTDVGDSAWIVGDTGLIISPSKPTELSSALIKLIETGELEREKLGQRARERISNNFDLEDIVKKYQEFYKSI